MSDSTDDSQAVPPIFGRLLNTGLFENPRLNFGMPLAQQVERANPVMLLCGRRWLVTHDLRRDSRGAFHPLGERAKGSAQAVNAESWQTGSGQALLCMMRGS